MDAMRKIDKQFVEYKEYDASTLFNRIVEILNDVGDRSALRPEAANQRPNAVLMAAQDKRILEGELLRLLPQELTDYRITHRAIGFDSDTDRATSIEIVEESACIFNSCLSPHGRSF
jgi:hypothetical protein